MTNSSPAYNPSITAIKMVALLGIMFFHLQLFPLGSQGIIVFVVCSGYNYYYLYCKKRQNGYRRIFSHQAQKLLIALFLSYSIMAMTDSIFFHRYSIYKIIASYLLIFLGVFVSEVMALINYTLSILGANIQLPYFPSNGVLWFISLVLWLYLLFPAFKTAMESRYRFVVLAGLLILSFAVRNYSSFRYPYNSISANLLNFYSGMLVLRYEKVILEWLGENRKETLAAIFILVAVYVFYGWHANRIFSYGMMAFVVLYLCAGTVSSGINRVGGCLYSFNSVIMFLVFLHIPAQSIRDAVLKMNEHNDWGFSLLSYGIYFLYTFLLAVAANKLYEIIQPRLVSRFARS